MALNPKQSQFVVEYVKDFNATQAAIRAGYSERTAGSQGFDLLKKPEIADAIRQIQTEKRRATIMDYDEACEILSGIARGQVAGYLNEDGVIDTDLIRDNNPGAVQAVEQRTDVSDKGEATKTTKFKLHPPVQAITQLAKMKGWDAPVKQDVTMHQSLADMLVAAGMDDAEDSTDGT